MSAWHREVSIALLAGTLLIGESPAAAPPELRHGSYVHAVSFSRDGTRLASASNDGTVRVWNPASGQELHRLETGDFYVRAVAFSTDGSALVGGCKEKIILCWDAETGKLRHRLEGHAGPVNAVAVAPDGKVLASGGEGPDLILWDVKEGKQTRSIPTPHKEIQTLAYSPDGKVVATAGRQEPFVVFWDPLTGKELRRSQARHGGISSIAFAPDGKTLAAAGTGPIRFYDVKTLKDVALQSIRMEGAFDGVYSVAYSTDGKYLAYGCQDKSVRLSEVATQEEVLCWKDLHSWVYAVAFAPDGRTVALADHGYAVRLWDVTGLATEEKAAAPTPEELNALWTALDGMPARAHQAVWKLAACPEQSVPWLRDRLGKLPPSKTDRVAGLIKDLDSDDFDRRQQATTELAKLGRAAEPALRQALAGELPSLEVRRRIERIVEKIDGPICDPEVLRAQRVMAALERMGTVPAARELLDSLADRKEEGCLTQEARAARARLAARAGTGKSPPHRAKD